FNDGATADQVLNRIHLALYHFVSGALIICLRSSGSTMTTALAGSSAVSDSFKQNRNSGLALRFANQSRRARGLFLPSASGVPQIMIRPPILQNQISVFRGNPVFAPLVMMSMVRSLRNAALIASFIVQYPFCFFSVLTTSIEYVPGSRPKTKLNPAAYSMRHSPLDSNPGSPRRNSMARSDLRHHKNGRRRSHSWGLPSSDKIT